MTEYRVRAGGQGQDSTLPILAAADTNRALLALKAKIVESKAA